MSAGLTLLFLCNHTELHSPLIPELLATGFQLLIEHNPDDAKHVASRLPVDAIMIRHSDVQDGTLLGADLKLLAPRTPVILFPLDAKCKSPQLGIDSLCHADPQDESVARAVAVFFHLSLTAQAPYRTVQMPNGIADIFAISGKWQLSL
jgi:hypothetical protein